MTMVVVPKDGDALGSVGRDNRMVLYTGACESVCLRDWFIGQALVITLGGPSLAGADLDALRASGVMTMGVNNTWAVYRPDLWVSADAASTFLDSGWADPRILKFAPLAELRTRLRRKLPDGSFVPISRTPMVSPRTLFYKRRAGFHPDLFLDQPLPAFGAKNGQLDLTGVRGCRSVLLIALRLAHYLGFRRVALIGADFRVPDDGPQYASGDFHEPRVAAGNRNAYRALDERLGRLSPVFARAGFSVVNATPGSAMQALPVAGLGEFLEQNAVRDPVGMDAVGWYATHPAQRRTELDHFIDRDGGPYSSWHQKLYAAAASLVSTKVASVLDVGCGVGVGLDILRRTGHEGRWTGLDPMGVPPASLGPQDRYESGDLVGLASSLPPSDHVWCVEVLEHLPGDPMAFLRALRALTRVSAFVSTPNSDLNKHGTRSAAEWAGMLRAAGFVVARVPVGGSVAFLCEPVNEGRGG